MQKKLFILATNISLSLRAKYLLPSILRSFIFLKYVRIIALKVECLKLTTLSMELNILILNHFCGDVVEDRSEGEGSDLCDLQDIPRKKKNSVKRKKGSKNGPQHKKNIQ